MRKNSYYIFGLTVLYFTLSLIGILHHEIWLDEAQNWLLARDSSSISNLINNTRYEGHPIMWNVLLYYITRFTHNPFWMQFLHILISTATIFIFLKNAPFRLLFKVLFIFGYFMFYEYNIISRNYILGILFLFLAINTLKTPKKTFTLFCVYLAFASNTHLIFLIISFALYLSFLFQNINTLIKKIFSYGTLLFFIGFLISTIQIIPPEDTTFFNHVNNFPLKEKFTFGFTSLFKGLFPMPDFRSIHFWNTNLFFNLNKYISAFLSLLVYGIPLLLFSKKKDVLFFFYTGLIGAQLFFFITQMSSNRYFGIAFIIFIIALWMDNYSIQKQFTIQKNNLKKTIIYSIIIVQFISGIISYSMDLKHPFSNGKDIISFLKEEKLKDHLLVTPFCEGTLISPYSDKKIFSLCDNILITYCNWNSYYDCNQSNNAIIEKISALDFQENIILISKNKFLIEKENNTWHKINEKLSIKKLKKLDAYIVKNIDYSIYEIKNNTYENN